MGHAHPVRLEQDIPHHPAVDVEVLHPGDVVQAFTAGIPRRGPAGGVGGGNILEQSRLLFFREHIGVADKTFLQGFGSPDQEGFALEKIGRASCRERV